MKKKKRKKKSINNDLMIVSIVLFHNKNYFGAKFINSTFLIIINS